MLLLGNLPLLRSILIIKITLIQSYRHLQRKQTSKSPLKSLPSLKSSHDKQPLVNFLVVDPIISFSGPSIAKYIEDDLQKIFRIVLKAHTPLFDRFCENLLKARLPDVYCGKFHIEYYNFCQ